eukprot:4001101-Pyramimonas_sp.AAC.1
MECAPQARPPNSAVRAPVNKHADSTQWAKGQRQVLSLRLISSVWSSCKHALAVSRARSFPPN